MESSTKNHRARTVVIPDLVHDYMGELFLQQAREGRIILPDDYIFSTAEGPAHPDSFTRRLRRLYQKNDFPAEYHLHTPRHTNASMLIAQGVDVRTVAGLLGHAQPSTTLDIYSHAFDKNKRLAGQKLSEAMGL